MKRSTLFLLILFTLIIIGCEKEEVRDWRRTDTWLIYRTKCGSDSLVSATNEDALTSDEAILLRHVNTWSRYMSKAELIPVYELFFPEDHEMLINTLEDSTWVRKSCNFRPYKCW